MITGLGRMVFKCALEKGWQFLKYIHHLLIDCRKMSVQWLARDKKFQSHLRESVFRTRLFWCVMRIC